MSVAAALWTRARLLCDVLKQQRCEDGIVRCQRVIAVDAELASIARRTLNIQTLATRKMDSLVFHEVAVWQVLATLRLCGLHPQIHRRRTGAGIQFPERSA